MEDPFADEPAENAGWKRYLVPGVVGIGLLTGGVLLITNLSAGGSGMTRRDAITIVSLPPPPPPPPPPANTPPPTEVPQRTEQPMIKEEQPQPQAAPPKDEPPLGTGIKGDGVDSFGLGSKAGNGRIGGTASTGSKWGWYANQVQGRVVEAMQRNRKARAARLNVTVKVWPDSGGRIARAQMAGSTGDAALDSAICNEVLVGLQLNPPPPGMPAPITLRLAARRP